MIPSPGRQDADDAVARHGAAVGREAHRQIAIDAADRNRGALLTAAGRLIFDALGALEAEPAAVELGLLLDGGGALLLVVGIHRARDVGGAHLAAPHGREHLVERRARQPRQRALQLLVGIGDLGALA